MKNVILGLVIAVATFGAAYAGDCACESGSCAVARVPRRVVTITKNVVAVPVEVTTRSVTRVRNFGRRVFGRRYVVCTPAETGTPTPTAPEVVVPDAPEAPAAE